MLEIPTLRVLRLQAQQDMNTEVNGALGSALRTAIAFALAGLVYALMTALQFLSRQPFIDTADDAFSLLIASIYGVTPTPATGMVASMSASPRAYSTMAPPPIEWPATAIL